MKYLYTRDGFLINVKSETKEIKNLHTQINESTLTNDITFGGSLLGRFINSTIRKAMIEVNAMRVVKIAADIERTLLELLMENTGVNVIDYEVTGLLYQIYRIVYNVDKYPNLQTDAQKKTPLINLTKQLIAILEKNTNDELKIGKNAKVLRIKLIDQLKKFLKALEDIKEEEEEEEEEQSAEPTDNTDENIKNTKQILTCILGIHKALSKKTSQLALNAGAKIPDTKALPSGKTGEEQAKIEGTKEKEQGKIETTEKSNQKLIEAPKSTKTNDSYIFDFDDFIKEKIEDNNYLKYYQDRANDPTSTEEERKMAKKQLEKLKKQQPVQVNKSETEQPKLLSGSEQNDGQKKIGMPQTTTNKPVQKNEIIERIRKSLQTSGLESMLTQGKIQKIVNDSNELEKIAEDLYGDKTEPVNKSILKFFESIKDLKEIKDIPEYNNIVGNKTFNIASYVKSFITRVENIEKIKESLFINYNLILEDDAPQSGTASIPSDDSTENTDSQVETQNAEESEESAESKSLVKTAWENNFTDDEVSKWGLKNWEEIQIELNKVSKQIDSKSIEIKVSDNEDKIIKIADLFGKAYRCFTTQLIPSGRPNGRISNRTFNEYLFLGDRESPSFSGDSGPGYGPWASKKVFYAFTDKIEQILADKTFRPILDKIRIILPDGTIESKGNLLTEFIRDMIDEDRLKRYGKLRSELLNKYFGLKKNYSDSSGDYSSPNNDTTIGTDDNPNNPMLDWINPTAGLIDTSIKSGYFIAITYKKTKTDKTGKLSDQYVTLNGQVIKVEGDYCMFKFQKNADGIPQTYSKEGGKKLPELHPGVRFQSQPVYLGMIKLPITVNKKQFKLVYFKMRNEKKVITTSPINKETHILGIKEVNRVVSNPLATGIKRLCKNINGKFQPVRVENWERANTSVLPFDCDIKRGSVSQGEIGEEDQFRILQNSIDTIR